MKEKRIYDTPTAEILFFKKEDVICASGSNPPPTIPDNSNLGEWDPL